MLNASVVCRCAFEFRLADAVAAQSHLFKGTSNDKPPPDSAIQVAHASSFVIPDAAQGNVYSGADSMTAGAAEDTWSMRIPPLKEQTLAGSRPRSIPQAEQQDDDSSMHAGKNVDQPTEGRFEANVREGSRSAGCNDSPTAMLCPPGNRTWSNWLLNSRTSGHLGHRKANTEVLCDEAEATGLRLQPDSADMLKKTPDLELLHCSPVHTPPYHVFHDTLQQPQSGRGSGQLVHHEDSSGHCSTAGSAQSNLGRQQVGSSSPFKIHDSRHLDGSTERHEGSNRLRTSSELSLPSALSHLDGTSSHASASAHGTNDTQYGHPKDANKVPSYRNFFHESATTSMHRWRSMAPAGTQHKASGSQRIPQEQSRTCLPGPAAEGAQDSSSSSHFSADPGLSGAPHASELHLQSPAGFSAWLAIQKVAGVRAGAAIGPRPSTSSNFSQASEAFHCEAAESERVKQSRRQSVRISVPEDASLDDVIPRIDAATPLNGATLLGILPPMNDLLSPAAPADMLLACMQALPISDQLQLQHEAFHVALCTDVHPDK
jgi:hypothetical protein